MLSYPMNIKWLNKDEKKNFFFLNLSDINSRLIKFIIKIGKIKYIMCDGYYAGKKKKKCYI